MNERLKAAKSFALRHFARLLAWGFVKGVYRVYVDRLSSKPTERLCRGIFLGGYKDKDVRTFRVYFVFFPFICTGIM